MIQMQTKLKVADNSGPKGLVVIRPIEGASINRASIGDQVTATVKEAEKGSEIKKGSLVRAVIVRTKKEIRRKDGSYIRFDDNAAVLINKQGEPVGTRVFGPIPRELREKNYMKIISLAMEVI